MFPSFSKSNAGYAALSAGAVLGTYAGVQAYKSHIEEKNAESIYLQNQTVEIDPVEHIRRDVHYKDIDIYSYYKTIHPNIKTLGEIFYQGYSVSNDGPCLTNVDLSNQSSPFNWICYSTALQRIRFIGSHLWTKGNLIPMESKVAILSLNRPEYTFVEYASYMYGFTLIGLYTSYDSQTILSLLEKTKVEVLIIDNLDRIKSFENQLLENPQIKEILVMDQIEDKEKNAKIETIPMILKTMQQSDVRPLPQIDPSSIATFILTSGTTGEPKLAMLSHENILSMIKGGIARRDRTHPNMNTIHRHCSFLPLAHLYERINIFYTLIDGGQVAYCPIVERIFEYYAIVKPTSIGMVPRVLNKIYDQIMTETNQSKIKRFLLSQALYYDKPSLFSRFIFRHVKQLFGGEIEQMVTASAPITPEVLHFFRIALGVPIFQAYGQTESTAAGSATYINDLSCGTVGTPGSTLEMKLVDVPNTNYRTDNNQGEICIRGPTVFKGYYGDINKTRETIDEGGWLHTGDVGEWTTNGALRIIDRTKHIFKLNQGEYIAPERLEHIYIRSRWIQQLFIDGISTESTVVAIVIPDQEYIKENFNNQTSFQDLCQDQKLKEIILTDLKRLAKQYHLKYYETVSNIYLHPHLFSQQNGLITSTFKTRRTAARQYFQTIIQSLYHNTDKITKYKGVDQQSKL